MSHPTIHSSGGEQHKNGSKGDNQLFFLFHLTWQCKADWLLQIMVLSSKTHAFIHASLYLTILGHLKAWPKKQQFRSCQNYRGAEFGFVLLVPREPPSEIAMETNAFLFNFERICIFNGKGLFSMPQACLVIGGDRGREKTFILKCLPFFSLSFHVWF